MKTLQRNLIQFLRLRISLALIKISINFYHHYIYIYSSHANNLYCSCKFHRGYNILYNASYQFN